jgi:phosphoribosylformylglycinamidine synthase
MNTYRIEIGSRATQPAEGSRQLLAALQEAGLRRATGLLLSRLFFLEGELQRGEAERIAAQLLADPVTEQATLLGRDDPPPKVDEGCVALEVHLRPGVMDPVAESTLAELRAEGFRVDAVRTGRRYIFHGQISQTELLDIAGRVLANDCIEQIVPGTAGVQPSPRPPVFEFRIRRIPLRELDGRALDRLSREAHLFLSRDEMTAIQQHFRALDRDPTDVELETLAQTWSEHCIHKTLRSPVAYRGAPLPTPEGRPTPDHARDGRTETRRYGNLLKETIVRATEELISQGRGPQCLSVFKDNAGVIGFDERVAIAFKVETHNHPSAIEPYGGAATGIGGVIRDIIGCGLGAKPIADTNVFCVAPSDWHQAPLPKGVLHPWRVLRGVVQGVADYGNRMGIPTVNGAVCFDPRYLGNPLVFCGCVGIIPRTMIEKAARPGDLIVVIGGRTGRDGIHGATFSSAELTDTHADEFSHAVQIGNAITEKRFLDAVLQARDQAGGCLYTAITDCGAGGLSSAVGEMGQHTGAVVNLDRVPLKYAGLRYDEIWISEAQERMVLAVPPDNLARFIKIMQDEEVEATVIGAFGGEAAAADDDGPRIVLRYQGQVVGDIDMRFLHHGLPRRERQAEWWPASELPPEITASLSMERPARRPAVTELRPDTFDRLPQELARPNVASKEWVIRQYDHEVQGGSVVKPLLGPGRGPGDAAVLRPRLESQRGIAIGCGLAPHLADMDPYWMAVASIDEAIRNVICVGGDPDQTAILDNFCWGCADEPRQLGALVRACQACYDTAKAYGVPFISGKDSLNNEFTLDAADVEPLLAALRQRAEAAGVDAERLRAVLPVLEAQVRRHRRLVIPPTLLISAVSIVDDVRRCLTPDLKRPGNRILLIGGLPRTGFALSEAASVHRAVGDLIQGGLLAACHDVSDGGWLVALAEMALAGNRGARITSPTPIPGPSTSPTGGRRYDPFDEYCAGYVVETPDADAVGRRLEGAGVRYTPLGTVNGEGALTGPTGGVAVARLRSAWSGQCS